MAKKWVEEHIESYDFSSGVDEFIQYLEVRIKETGEPRENISIEVETVPAYGGDKAVITLGYECEETVDERKARLHKEQSHDKVLQSKI